MLSCQQKKVCTLKNNTMKTIQNFNPEGRKIIVATAPSGAGKSTLIDIVEKRMALGLRTISNTSREIRNGEINGKDYHYNSLEEFQKLINEDYFLEWEEVYKNSFYGTAKTEIPRIWSLGKIPLLDIDVNGALKVKKMFGKNALIIGIDVPGNTIEEKIETLRFRLETRDKDSLESIARRLKKADKEFKLMLQQKNFPDFIVHNSKKDFFEKDVLEIINNFISVAV